MSQSLAGKFREWSVHYFSSDVFLLAMLAISVAVGPFFFIPARGMSVAVGKEYFFIIIGLAMVLWTSVSILKKGTWMLANNGIVRVLGFIVGCEFLGALLSPSFGVSFFGNSFETTAVVFTIAFGIFFLIAHRVVRSYERMAILYGSLVVGATVATVFQVARFFRNGSFLSLGVLSSTTSSIVGSWTDFGILLGFVAIFCMITLELGGLRRGVKSIVIGLGILALILLAFMNLRTIWIILGFTSLASALYIFTLAYWDSNAKAYRKHRTVPWYGLAVVIISVACLFFGPRLNSIASTHQNIVSNDIKLSTEATARVAVASVSHNFVVGYGPDTFSNVWNLAKPPIISRTEYGETRFDYGSGFFPTELATNGILGILGWIALLVLIIVLIVQSLMRVFESSLERYMTVLLCASVSFLLFASWFSVAGSYVLIVFAILLGTLAAARSAKNGKSEKAISFMNDPRASFFGILGITVLILVVVFVGYLETRRIVGAVYEAKGANAEVSQNLDLATTDFSIATAYAQSDSADRELSALTIESVNKLASTVPSANQSDVSKQAESILGTALADAQSAVAVDPANYENRIAVGNVYRTLVTLGVTDAASQAQASYAEAQKRDPHDSLIFLSFAELDLAQSDSSGALAQIADSINYEPTAPAYELRAQIQMSEQDSADALVSMEAAYSLDPYDATVAYQLGLLFYQEADYADAISAFKSAIYDDRSFGLAYGYLGVSYEKSGDMTDANLVYNYMRSQSDQADALIAQIKSGAAAAAPAAAKLAPTPEKK